LGETLTEPNNFSQMSAAKRNVVPLGTGNRKIHLIRVDIAPRHYETLNEAIATYRQAIQLDPNNSNAYAGLANSKISLALSIRSCTSDWATPFSNLVDKSIY
jgi:hypothetical protein